MAVNTVGLEDNYGSSDDLPSSEVNKHAARANLDETQLCELLGTDGCFLTTDFNATIIPGQVALQISAGRAAIGDTGGRIWVYQSGAVTITTADGLTASATNYVYKKRDGTFTANTTGVKPANSTLVASGVASGSAFTSVNNNPTGRVNLLALALLGLAQTWSGKQTFGAGLDVSDGQNVGLGTGTGTKWGTAVGQKQAWWNATPVVQPASANQAATSAPAAFGNTDNEIGGLTISAAYDQAEVTVLRDKCEELADDCRALRATVAAQGVLINQLRSDLVTVGLIKGSA